MKQSGRNLYLGMNRVPMEMTDSTSFSQVSQRVVRTAEQSLLLCYMKGSMDVPVAVKIQPVSAQRTVQLHKDPHLENELCTGPNNMPTDMMRLLLLFPAAPSISSSGPPNFKADCTGGGGAAMKRGSIGLICTCRSQLCKGTLISP